MTLDFQNITDEELIKLYRDGNKQVEQELMDRYMVCVRQMAAPLYLVGGDKDDLIQEGNMGLYQAILRYDPDKSASFETFARLCIRRAQYKAIENSNRKKNEPLNFRLSIDGPAEDGDKPETADDSLNPENILLDRERSERFSDRIRESLSKFETQVFDLYVSGMDYVEIAGALGKDKKSIDNAIQRIRRKVKEICSKDF